MVNLVNKSNVNKVVGQLLSILNSRSKDVISRRFGIKSGKKETLDFIGQGYGITRERVRQIEEVVLTQMRAHLDANFSKNIEPYVSAATSVLEEHGGTLKEDQLFEQLIGHSGDKTTVATLTFVLSLDGKLKRFGETDNFHGFWTISDKYAENSTKIAASLVGAFDKNDEPVHEKELFNFYRKHNPSENHNPKTFLAAVNLSKDVAKNIFDEVGLTTWPDIKPRGVRDKAFLVLKRDGKPKHFREITKMINAANFSNRKANVQTVHNELIKDKRFVLIGRGTYGLAQWGYKAGTVKDVLVDLLRSAKKPMPRSELVSQVLSHRIVKENTILLNLQDSKVFKKTDSGHYILKEA